MESVLQRLVKEAWARWPEVVLSILSLTAFVGSWWALHQYFVQQGSIFAEYLPSPGSVWDALWGLLAKPDPYVGVYILDHIAASLERITLGFALALALALPAGLLMGRLRGSHAVGRPIVEVFRPIPPLAWIPIFLIIFGVFWGPVAIVFLGIFFPVLFNVMFGAKSVDPTLVDAAKTLGASRATVFEKIVFPYTIPYLMTGIKVGLGIGWMCIVAAEMVAAKGGGIGYFILAMADFSAYEEMYAGMVIIGVLSVLTTGVAALVESFVYKRMGMD
jgi:NitT/TauT family transport system permease protein